MRIFSCLFLSIFLLAACGDLQDTSLKISDESDYQEKYRPQYHFSPDSGWMNDPNGMVYYEGEYHLFYQYRPDSTIWGPMHWGHAVSTDLVHWQQLPIALKPDTLGYIFTGSAVVDKNNSSGFGKDGDPPMVAIFTYNDREAEKAGQIPYQTQGLAYSNDKGRSWNKYKDNPILDNPGVRDFSDPKVFWYDKGKKWIMSLAVNEQISFYQSENLKDWEKMSDFGENLGAKNGVWESPDLFKLDDKWGLLVSVNPGGPNGGSATQYFIGDFDGEQFTVEDDSIRWLDYGTDNYAGRTWSNIPEDDGRRIFMGWMSNWQYAQIVPTERWRSAMTIPRKLELVESAAGIGLASVPVEELKQLRIEEKVQAHKASEVEELTGLNPLASNRMEIIIEIEREDPNSGFEIYLQNAMDDRFIIGLDAKENRFFMDRSGTVQQPFYEDFAEVHYAPRVSDSLNIKLRIFLDEASIEFFADDYTVAMTEIFFPENILDQLAFRADHPGTKMKSITAYPLKSIWK